MMPGVATLSVRGSWPGAVVLRAGWAKAHARPINDDLPDAVLRLERGSAAFLRRCVARLGELGAPGAVSPPLAPGSRSTWEAAGFDFHRRLLLMERPVDASVGDTPPSPRVRAGRASEWERAADVDRAAFPPDWRLGRLGLTDAVAATPRSRFLVAEAEGEVMGFAVVGVAHQTAYLQRLAVHPDASGRGLGRELVRAGLRWAHSRAARSMLLNTQPANDGAIALYRSEGFHQLSRELVLLRASTDE